MDGDAQLEQSSVSLLNWFEVVQADTPELLDEVFKLRYQFFCGPGLLSPEDYPEEKERDAYDEHAIHYLLRYKPTGEMIGSARLIIAPLNSDKDWRFPSEILAKSHLRYDAQKIPRSVVAEISRFVLKPHFTCTKWLVEESSKSSIKKTCNYLHPGFFLLAALVRSSSEHGILFWFAAMEKKLQRWGRMIGLCTHPISSEFAAFGVRRTYMAYIPNILENIQRVNPNAWPLFEKYENLVLYRTHKYQAKNQLTPITALGEIGLPRGYS